MNLNSWFKTLSGLVLWSWCDQGTGEAVLVPNHALGNFFLMSRVNLPWHSFIPFPDILREKNGTAETYHKNSLHQVEWSFVAWVSLLPWAAPQQTAYQFLLRKVLIWWFTPSKPCFPGVAYKNWTLRGGKDSSREPPPSALSIIQSPIIEGVLWCGTSLEENICVDIMN